MASAGNASAKAHGWYGTDDETGENHTFLGSIGETASDGWGLGHHVAGDGALGHVLGGWLAGWGGLGQTVLNTGAAAAGAVIPPMPWAGPRRNDGQLYYDDQGNPYTYHRPRRKQPAPPPPQGRYLDPTSVLGGTPVPSGLSVDEDGGDRVSAPALPPMLGPNPYEGLYDHCDEAAQVCYAE